MGEVDKDLTHPVRLSYHLNEREIQIMLYLATINTPGYLPWDDEPPTFSNAADAWEYLADLRIQDEEDFEGDGYSDTVKALTHQSEEGWKELATGTIWGPTVGDRMYDLGVNYSVSLVEVDEPIDVWFRFEDDDDEEAELEANTYQIMGGYRVDWCHSAVGLITSVEFGTLKDVHAWYNKNGFRDFSS